MERKEKERKLLSASILEATKKLELPDLVGSDKQILWANDVRGKYMILLVSILNKDARSEYDATLNSFLESCNQSIEQLECFLNSYVLNCDLQPIAKTIRNEKVTVAQKWQLVADNDSRDMFLEMLYSVLVSETSAHNWIELATKGLTSIAMLKIDAITAEYKRLQGKDFGFGLISEGYIEDDFIIRPDKPITENMVAVAILDGAVRVSLNERSESFNAVVKSLGYKWSPSAEDWYKSLDEETGHFLDKAAQLVIALVAKGFICSVADANVRQKVIDNDFQMELTEFVRFYQAPRGKQYLQLVWPYGSDHFRPAMRISGCKYVKPRILAPIGSHAEVCDFAERNGFTVLPDALAQIQAYQQKLTGGTVVSVVSTNVIPLKRACTRHQSLDVPEHVDIAASLADDIVEFDGIPAELAFYANNN